MREETRILLDQHDWWRRVEDEAHGALTGAAHELSDEVARTTQYLALLCGTLARDAGWGEEEVTRLATTIRMRLPYVPGIITDPVISLVLDGYGGSAGAGRE